MTPEFDFNDYNSYKQPLSEEFIERNTDRVCWNSISAYQKLSEEFIERNADHVDWKSISKYQKLSEEFIERYSDRVDWCWISINQKLSEEFIERNTDRLNWWEISKYQKLSEEFIERNAQRVDWWEISQHQKLSEEFIERNADRVAWSYISELSEPSFKRNVNRVNWANISRYQKLSEEFRLKHNLNQPENNWLYTDKETKRKAIENCNLYELDGDYVIAFKGIRSDGYSYFNFQYHYELGGIYEAHADHNLNNENSFHNLNNENSFGLSAWTEESARDYCDQKLIKVKIHLDDVAALVHNGGKIRCTRFEVIEEL
jgi:Txe/YoeB family toxin of Txe-Axe toxin-antitoxin module